MRRRRCGQQNAYAEPRAHTGVHLAQGCSIAMWLIATGIEPHPGPVGNFVTWPEAVRNMQETDAMQGAYTQVGGGSGSSGIASGHRRSSLEANNLTVFADTDDDEPPLHEMSLSTGDWQRRAHHEDESRMEQGGGRGNDSSEVVRESLAEVLAAMEAQGPEEERP